MTARLFQSLCVFLFLYALGALIKKLAIDSWALNVAGIVSRKSFPNACFKKFISSVWVPRFKLIIVTTFLLIFNEEFTCTN